MLAMMEKEFISSINDISHMAERMHISTKEQQKGAIDEATEQLEAADDLFKQMEQEVIDMHGSEKTSYQAKLRKYKADLEEAKRKVNKMEYDNRLKSNKETAMGADIDPSSIGDHKQHLLKPEGMRMQRQNHDLEEAVKIGEEAELEARDIKINLDHNARNLDHARDNVRRINGNLSVGNRLIDTMRRHEFKNKMIIYCVFVILIIAALIIGYIVVIK